MKPPYNLRCEYLKDPINIDVKQPRFSWHLLHEERNQNQSAYQILVSSTRDLIESEKGDIWDTGKIKSKKNSKVIYEGNSLNSDSSYFWRVKWWDKNDKETLEMISEFEISGNEIFGFGFFLDEQDDGDKIEYESIKSKISVGNEIGKIKLQESDKKITFHIFIDRSVIEIFINYHDCVTSRIFPKTNASNGFTLFSRQGSLNLKRLDIWSLDSIW